MARNKILKATSNAEILSFIINQTPELASDIDLPVQGESTKPIGKLIMDNARYKNAFINTVNLIGLTVIKENRWENPWATFTDKGMLRYGQQIREIIQDLAHVFDYNKNYNNKAKFLETAVPDVYQYIHEINFQKVWETTVNESELLMAFDDEENGLYKFIEDTISNLYETYDYDKWLVDKYQLCRRMIDGTITSKQITETDARDILAKMKSYSNKMSFKSPNYNPAGVRRATKHEDQFLMLDADREAITSTNVLATSYFLNEAETKTNLALIDSFSESDEDRLAVLLEEQYIPFTDAEKTALATVLGLIISRDFFMDYHRALDTNPDTNGKRQTEWENPTTLDRNVFLHGQEVISTSPFANAVLFTTVAPTVTGVTISPSTATVSKGQKLELTATTTTTGFANKAVSWGINAVAKTAGASINESGVLTVPSTYNSTGSGTAGVWTIGIDTILETGDIVEVNGIKYTVDASSQDTIAKQITAMKSAFNNAAITDYFTVGGTSTTTTLTQKSGYYGQVEPIFEFTAGTSSAGESDITETTAGVVPNNTIVVKATSIYDDTVSNTATITVV